MLPLGNWPPTSPHPPPPVANGERRGVRRDDALKPGYSFKILLTLLVFCCAVPPRHDGPPRPGPQRPPALGPFLWAMLAAPEVTLSEILPICS
jgi:hypothetical protein